MRSVANLHVVDDVLAFGNWQSFGSPTNSRLLGAGGPSAPPPPPQQGHAEQSAQCHSWRLGRSPKRDAPNDHQL